MNERRIPGLAIAVLAVVALTLTACATQPVPAVAPAPPGFFSAILHGFIAPFALIVGIIFDVRIYSFPNSGWWYDLGFLIGLALWSAAFAAKGRR